MLLYGLAVGINIKYAWNFLWTINLFWGHMLVVWIQYGYKGTFLDCVVFPLFSSLLLLVFGSLKIFSCLKSPSELESIIIVGTLSYSKELGRFINLERFGVIEELTSF